jgi:hypothetical protein
VQHPNITVVHDVGSHEGVPFIVMELLVGENLKSIIEGHRNGLEIEDVLRYGRQVADGLDAAHRNGVVHRDVKPSNVMVVDGRAKLCDFGIARVVEDGPVDGTRGIGSPPFMAPEQFNGRVDTRADLYSLGCLLHTMCLGVPPFTGENSLQIIYQHEYVDAKPMRQQRTDLPQRLDGLVMRLLEKDPHRRPQSAGEVTTELRKITAELQSLREPMLRPLPGLEPTGVTDPRVGYVPASIRSLRAGTPLRIRTAEAEAVARRLRDLLRAERVDATVGAFTRGPVVTRYEVRLGPSTSSARLRELTPRVAETLDGQVMFVSKVPSTSSLPDIRAVGFDVVNSERDLVSVGDVLRDSTEEHGMLKIGLGRGISGSVVVDLATLPHLLIAGGFDGSVGRAVDSLLVSLLTTTVPDELCLVMADPSGVGLPRYEGVPHVFQRVSTTAAQTVGALEAIAHEMDSRYADMAAAGSRFLDNYNAAVMEGRIAPPVVRFGRGDAPCHPRLVMVLADLSAAMGVAADRTVRSLAKITQRGRAAGVHLVVTASRISEDLLPRRARSGFAGRLVLTTRTAEESVLLLGSPGAEQLLDRGDALFQRLGMSTVDRIQCATATSEDVDAVIGHWRSQTD